MNDWYAVAALLVLAGVWLPGRVPRQALLLAASYVFYWTWGGWFVGLLAASSVANYGFGILIRRRPSLVTLWAGIGFNLALLVVFRYLAPVLGAGSGAMHALFAGAAPVGISFWTFQALSYLFDIYREEEADPSLLELSLYMAFAPTVIMGPVCRLPALLEQFRAPRPFSAADLQVGVFRIALGIVLKLGCAQVLASGWQGTGGITAGFETPTAVWHAADVWLLAFGFGFQLFFDFAAYSHIAIGAARIFGFRLQENFDAPYLAPTPSEFWNRWHMSLSSWIRDYVFVPLAVLVRVAWWRYAALVLSMALFGLWHGATITFLAWGVYNGALLATHRFIQATFRGRLPGGAAGTLASWALTLPLVMLGWILFRANTSAQAFAMVRAVVTPSAYHAVALPSSLYVLVAVLGGTCLILQLVGGVLSAALARRHAVASRDAAHEAVPAPAAAGVLAMTWRWMLVPPLAVVMLYAWLFDAVGKAAVVSPFVYRLF